MADSTKIQNLVINIVGRTEQVALAVQDLKKEFSDMEVGVKRTTTSMDNNFKTTRAELKLLAADFNTNLDVLKRLQEYTKAYNTNISMTNAQTGIIDTELSVLKARRDAILNSPIVGTNANASRLLEQENFTRVTEINEAIKKKEQEKADIISKNEELITLKVKLENEKRTEEERKALKEQENLEKLRLKQAQDSNKSITQNTPLIKSAKGSASFFQEVYEQEKYIANNRIKQAQETNKILTELATRPQTSAKVSASVFEEQLKADETNLTDHIRNLRLAFDKEIKATKAKNELLLAQARQFNELQKKYYAEKFSTSVSSSANDLRRTAELEKSIIVHGVEARETIILKSTQREAQIYEERNRRVLAIERALADGRINYTKAQNLLTFVNSRALESIKANTAALQQQIPALENQRRSTKNLLLLVFEYIGAYRLLNAAYNTTFAALTNIPAAGIREQGNKASITAIFGSLEGAKNLAYLKDIAQTAGQDIKALEQAYRSYAPSAMLAGASQEEVNRVFKDFAEVGTILHKTPDEMQSVFLALEQMYAKGVVQSEEIKKQLGNVLPAAVEIGAKAMGKTPAEFMAAMEKNEVAAKDFVPKFAKIYREIFGGPGDAVFKQVALNFQAQLARLGNQYEYFSRNIFNKIQETLSGILGAGADVLKKFNENLNAIISTAKIFGDIILVSLSVNLTIYTANMLKAIAVNTLFAESLASITAFASKFPILFATLRGGVYTALAATVAYAATSAIGIEKGFAKVASVSKATLDKTMAEYARGSEKAANFLTNLAQVQNETSNDLVLSYNGISVAAMDLVDALWKDFKSNLEKVAKDTGDIFADLFKIIITDQYSALNMLINGVISGISLVKAFKNLTNTSQIDPKDLGFFKQYRKAYEEEFKNLRESLDNFNKDITAAPNKAIEDYFKKIKAAREKALEDTINNKTNIEGQSFDPGNTANAQLTKALEGEAAAQKKALETYTKERKEQFQTLKSQLEEEESALFAKIAQQEIGAAQTSAEAKEKIHQDYVIRIKQAETEMYADIEKKSIASTDKVNSILIEKSNNFKEQLKKNISDLETSKQTNILNRYATSAGGATGAMGNMQILPSTLLDQINTLKPAEATTKVISDLKELIKISHDAQLEKRSFTENEIKAFMTFIDANRSMIEAMADKYFDSSYSKGLSTVAGRWSVYAKAYQQTLAETAQDNEKYTAYVASADKAHEDALQSQHALQIENNQAAQKQAESLNATVKKLQEANFAYMEMAKETEAQGRIERTIYDANEQILSLRKQNTKEANALADVLEKIRDRSVINIKFNAAQDEFDRMFDLFQLRMQAAATKQQALGSGNRSPIINLLGQQNVNALINESLPLMQQQLDKTLEQVLAEKDVVQQREHFLQLLKDQLRLEDFTKQRKAEQDAALTKYANGPYGNFQNEMAQLEQQYKLEKALFVEHSEEMNQLEEYYEERRLQIRLKASETTFQMMSESFMSITQALVQSYGQQSAAARGAFMMYKAFAIAQTTIAAYTIAQEAYKNASMIPYIGTYLAPVAAATALASSLARVYMIASQPIPAAHGGLNEVPAEQTYLLNKGERVLSPKQNKDLTEYLKSQKTQQTVVPNGKTDYNVRIINSIDPALMTDYMGSPEGERIILNVIRRNRSALA